MVRQASGAATRFGVAAPLLVCLVLLVAGCTAFGEPLALDVQPGYMDSLRGADSLAHGTAEEPPKAMLAASAHAAALLRTRGESVEVDPSFWRDLVAPSGEDAVWVGYYACLVGADRAAIEQILGESVELLVSRTEGGDEVNQPLSGNDALEQLTGRRVRECLGMPFAAGRVEVSEKDAIIVKARLKRAGFDGGPLPSDLEVEHVASLVGQQGCNGWNQASSWAVSVLRPDVQNATLQQCRNLNDLVLDDPVGLYTSVELGMSQAQAQAIASTEELRTWLSSEWTVRDPGQPSTGNGSIANTVLLVELARLKGWSLPAWVAGGVAEASRAQKGYDPALVFLCQAVPASCEPALVAKIPTQLEVAERVLDHSMTDGEGRLAALASLGDAVVREGLCGEDATTLYRTAPQVFSTLASVDKTCWEPLAPSVGELTDRITSALSQGNLDEARALMLLAEAVHGKVLIREQMAPRVRDAWALTLNAVGEQRGPAFLKGALPLNFVLFSATLEEWS